MDRPPGVLQGPGRSALHRARWRVEASPLSPTPGLEAARPLRGGTVSLPSQPVPPFSRNRHDASFPWPRILYALPACTASTQSWLTTRVDIEEIRQYYPILRWPPRALPPSPGPHVLEDREPCSSPNGLSRSRSGSSASRRPRSRSWELITPRITVRCPGSSRMLLALTPLPAGCGTEAPRRLR